MVGPGTVAVITGGASGIGLAAAKKLSSLGATVVIADRDAAQLDAARAALPYAHVVAVDVSDRSALAALEEDVATRFGGTDVLMNNAGIGRGTSCGGELEAWEAVLGTNLWGVIHGTQVFLPRMLARQRPGRIINTGSKQGITTPPGNPAYNVSKAGVKVFTEALEHELRSREGRTLRAHLFVPGFVFTGMSGAHTGKEKPAGAWTAEQTVDFMLARVEAGDFYVICPDNEVTRAMDEARMRWAMEDIIENRPPLSRWHPDHATEFAAVMKATTARRPT